MLLFCVMPGLAGADQIYSISGKGYVLPDSSDYVLSDGYQASLFFYGAQSMGNLRIIGDVEEETTFDGVDAFAPMDGNAEGVGITPHGREPVSLLHG